MAATTDPEFPCSILLDVPLPDSRLATTALKAIQVDPELSPLVRRQLTVVPAPTPSDEDLDVGNRDAQILRVEYKATTNRMLRVAVNGFMENLKLVLEVMEQLDTDVLDQQKEQDLELEQQKQQQSKKREADLLS